MTFDNRIGSQSCRQADHLYLRWIVAFHHLLNGVRDSFNQVVSRRQRFCLGNNLAAGLLQQHGIGVGSTGIYSKPETHLKHPISVVTRI